MKLQLQPDGTLVVVFAPEEKELAIGFLESCQPADKDAQAVITGMRELLEEQPTRH